LLDFEHLHFKEYSFSIGIIGGSRYNFNHECGLTMNMHQQQWEDWCKNYYLAVFKISEHTFLFNVWNCN